jgi:hypothetical protein
MLTGGQRAVWVEDVLILQARQALLSVMREDTSDGIENPVARRAADQDVHAIIDPPHPESEGHD